MVAQVRKSSPAVAEMVAAGRKATDPESVPFGDQLASGVQRGPNVPAAGTDSVQPVTSSRTAALAAGTSKVKSDRSAKAFWNAGRSKMAPT